jgi:hypothetical protein
MTLGRQTLPSNRRRCTAELTACQGRSFIELRDEQALVSSIYYGPHHIITSDVDTLRANGVNAAEHGGFLSTQKTRNG